MVERKKELREQAEQRLAALGEGTPDSFPHNSRALIHELHTHQIELEMQNEELRRSEQELIEARDRFADLYDFAPVGYATISDKGIIEQANLTLAGLLGTKRCRLIRQRFSGFITPEDSDSWYLHVVSILKQGERQACELKLRRADGSCFPAQLDCLRVVKDEETSVRMTLTDISERKKSELALNQYEKQCRALFENMIDVYYKTDLDGSINVISPSCLVQTGYRQEEILGRLAEDFYAEPEQRKELLRQLHEKGEVNDFEISLIHKDGSCRYASVTSHLLLNEKQQPLGVEGIVRNITERKQAKQAQDTMLNENRRLMRRLMQVQEEERRLLARDLHDELGQLLTSINVRAEYIAKHAENSDLTAMANEIIRDTRASFDTSHATLMKLRPGTLDALGLADALTELINQWDAYPGIDCTLQLNGEIDHLDDLHSIAIYRMVQEGLSNARRHGKATSVEIIVQVVPSHESRHGGHVQIEISDNGKGLHVPERSRGMGIIGMRERIQALEGTFLLTHIPHDGVRIEAMLPLESSEEDK